ncbi:hypothetical protein PG999_013072 [Apiospora kogelbergensis]|uniref:Uncharacterized protein n=1 Tax=Apiospora kogelbergensis TaxID=1337665 RepID=A0AAW0QED0_9PEZI
MFLSLEWSDKTGATKGKSFSTPFALSEEAPGQAGSGTLNALVTDLDKYDQSTPWRLEGPEPNQLVTVTTSAISTPASIATSVAAPGGASEMPATSNGGPEGEPGGNGGGLSTGAIAGIIVGAVIGGLLIISALAYFLCFRRRSGNQRNHHDIHGDVGYASDSGAAGMITREKDMAGVNHSPQSAYADDGSRLHNVGDFDHGNESTNYSNTPQEEQGVATGQNRDSLHQNNYSIFNNSSGNPDQGAAATHRHSTIGVAVSPQDAATESRRERTRSVGNVAVAVGRTSHQTSRPGSEARSPSRYAHLIEEGMTEDEIRRLEDEERQLDAAIEDAGRHGGRPRK